MKRSKESRLVKLTCAGKAISKRLKPITVAVYRSDRKLTILKGFEKAAVAIE